MSEKKRLVFVINPKSGTDRVKALQAVINETLDHGQFSYEIQATTHAGHGTELAREAAAAGAFAVVAVGGDGSVNDVVCGLLGSNTALGILPKGSGNGMARTMGLPLNPAAAVRVLNITPATPIDIGFANDRPFISNAGVGFDALISRKFATSKKRGLLIYSWLVIKYLWLYRVPKYNIMVDGKTISTRAFLISVANGRQFGYNFVIAPEASYTDGLLDVVVIRNFPRILGALLALRAMKGNILKSRYVQHFRGRDITIASAGLELMQIDGDAHACEPEIRFRIQQHALRVIAPASKV